MNQKLWSGLTATVLVATLGVAPMSHAEQSRITDEEADNHVPQGEALPEPSSILPSAAETSVLSSIMGTSEAPTEVVKVGEYQSQEEPEADDEAIATIHSHDMNGQPAATLYVRNIPVLTFLGSEDANSQSSAAEPTAAASNRPTQSPVGEETKLAASQDESSVAGSPLSPEDSESTAAAGGGSSDPVWRATALAARLNQFYRDNADPDTITVRWDSDRERYVIRVGDDDLVDITSQTILPDTTNNLAEDALQATNRLRRQLGESEPLSHIEGAPQARPQRFSIGPVQFTFSGMASWYGPGFNGRRSASGEVFNQNALTAAHRSLPFGTLVEVINVRNGRSVVVRINDRGPYSHRRVIDLSAAAAQAIGLIQAGVAPVRIHVLNPSNTASNPN